MLADDSGDGRSQYAERWKAKQSKNKDWVQNDIYDCPCTLDDHGADGIASSLKDALARYVDENGKREEETDGDILCPHLQEGGIICKESKKDLGEEESHDSKEYPAEEGEGKAVVGCLFSPYIVLGPEFSRQQGVDSHGCSYCHSDEQVLHGKGQRDGCEGSLAVLG